jgi:hypothetical protein
VHSFYFVKISNPKAGSSDKIEQEVTSSMTSEEVTSPNYEMMMSARNGVMSSEHK